MNEEYQRRLEEINARIDRLNKKDERNQAQKTGYAVSAGLHKDEHLRQEAHRRQEAAKSTFKSINKNGLPPKEQEQQQYDTVYKYQLGNELHQNQGKPLDSQTDVKIAKQLFTITKGEDFDKVKNAIEAHSPLAASRSEDKRHEYANAAATKGLEMHLKDIPKEEKTRIQTPHNLKSNLQEISQQDIAAMQHHWGRER